MFGFLKKLWGKKQTGAPETGGYAGKKGVVLEIRAKARILTALLVGVSATRREIHYYIGDPIVFPDSSHRVPYHKFFEEAGALNVMYSHPIERVLRLQVQGMNIPAHLQDVALGKLVKEIKEILTPPDSPTDDDNKGGSAGGGPGGGHGVNPLETPLTLIQSRGGNG